MGEREGERKRERKMERGGNGREYICLYIMYVRMYMLIGTFVFSIKREKERGREGEREKEGGRERERECETEKKETQEVVCMQQKKMVKEK